MNVINTIELAQELQARTSFSQQDATGIVQAIAKALDATMSNLVTREQFDARFAELDARIAGLRAELKTEIAGLRAELKTEIADLRSEMRTEIASLRAEMRTEFSAVRAESRTEIANLRAEFHQAIRAQTVWMASTMVAVAALVVAAFKLL
jgi:F0F1-type ATP synthase membrane subunit b/b'